MLKQMDFEKAFWLSILSNKDYKFKLIWDDLKYNLASDLQHEFSRVNKYIFSSNKKKKMNYLVMHMKRITEEWSWMEYQHQQKPCYNDEWRGYY